MPNKFQYSPGLPGYGTRGIDGSTGLSGLSTYFSSYNGNSDSVTIKSKIIDNKELFSSNDYLPGYPSRTYKNGDIFIDKNARIFQIDFNEPNLYKDTNIFLNTSGFFTQGPNQIDQPLFSRFSNSFDTEKFLIDVVYTNTVGDYTSYPASIYDNGPRYFSRVNYIGNDIVGNFNGWYPFEVWGIGSPDENNAIALTREEDNNTWHFGNYDDTSIRDVSLSLDFTNVYAPGDLTVGGTLYGNFSGSITTDSLYLSNWLTVEGDASFNDIYVSGNVIGDLNVNGNQDIGGDLEVVGAATFNNNIITEHILPKTGGWPSYTWDIGNSTSKFNNLWLKGYADISTYLNIGTTINAGGDITSEGVIKSALYYTSDTGRLIIGPGTDEYGIYLWPFGATDDTHQTIFGLSTTEIGTSLSVKGHIKPYTDTIYDLGDSTHQFGNIYIDEVAYLDSVSLAGHITPELNAQYDLGTDASQFRNLYVNGTSYLDAISVGGHIIPDEDTIYDLGSSGLQFGNIYIDEVAYLDQISMPNGSAATPAIHFSDSNSGLYSSGKDLIWSVDGTQRLSYTYGGSSSLIYMHNDPGEHGYVTVAGGGLSAGGDLILRAQDSTAAAGVGGNVVLYGGGSGGGAAYVGHVVFQNIRYAYPSDNGFVQLGLAAKRWGIGYFKDGIYSGTWVDDSDERYKTSIENIDDNILDRIRMLRPILYEWINPEKGVLDNGEKYTGFLAQDIEKIFPNLVTTQNLSIEEAEDPSILDPKAVNVIGMVPYLVKGMQKQQDQIDELKDIVAQQQKQINQLLNA